MKIKSVLVIAAALAVTAASTAYGASSYTPQHLRSLCDSVLGKQDVEEWQDLSSDGIVDSLDTVLLRKALVAPTGEFTESSYWATEENLRYIGRNYCDKDNAAWLVQSGSAVEFTVTGKSAEVTVLGDSSYKNEEKYQPRFAVLVDGEIILDAMMNEKSKTVTLFDGDVSRTAVVKIIHLSEAQNGPVGVGSVKVVSDVPVPVAPTAKKDLQIEFIGDSITCAYGVEGASQYEPFMTSTENFMKSYAYLTAEKLNADYSAVCYSGHGIISGYSNDGNKNLDSLVPDYYGTVGKSSPYNVPWDFDSHKTDVVVINLGTNDSSYIGTELGERADEYAEEYEKFLETVHEKNPEAYIICTLGTMGCTELYPYIETAVENFKAATGYDRIMSYESVTHTQADGLGSDWHPSEKTQLNSSYVLADKICQALGMESDQIGLDVAADAVYTAEQSDGANMSAYFSDWDKSFHITTVFGGDSRDAVKANISGIDMKKGGKYVLEFKCETAKGEEIPFTLMSRDGNSAYYQDVFVGTGEKTSYSAEFTCPETDPEAVLQFLMGGTDSLRLSLYELKITKIG